MIRKKASVRNVLIVSSISLLYSIRCNVPVCYSRKDVMNYEDSITSDGDCEDEDNNNGSFLAQQVKNYATVPEFTWNPMSYFFWYIYDFFSGIFSNANKEETQYIGHSPTDDNSIFSFFTGIYKAFIGLFSRTETDDFGGSEYSEALSPMKENIVSSNEDISGHQVAINPGCGETTSNRAGQKDWRSMTCGLVNQGNTCFMNSGLQCLMNCPGISDYFRKDMHKEALRKIEDKQAALRESGVQVTSHANEDKDKKIAIVKACGELLSQAHTAKNAITPSDIKDKMSSIPIYERYKGFSQHDAAEFITGLLTVLHEGLNDPDQSASADLEATWWDRNKSVITDLFYFSLKSTLTCCECGSEKATFDPMMCLPLEIPERNGEVTIQDCLNKFLENESLDPENPIHCDVCNVEKEFTRKLSLEGLPKHLIIELKRFENNGTSETKKIEKLVDYPLGEFLFGGVCYRVMATCNHYPFGSGNAFSGHYTADIRNENYDWYRYNDQSVKKITNKEVESNKKSTYVLFLERCS